MAVYDILPFTVLTDSDIRDTLRASGGVVDFDSRSWFKPEAKINMWSRYKPVEYDAPFLEEPLRSTITGFSYEDIKDGIFSIRLYTYKNPTSPTRSDDFRGYNRHAKAFHPYIPEATYVGAPPNTNIYISSNGDSAAFLVNVVLPEINLRNFHSYMGEDVPADGVIDIVFFYDNKINVLGSLDLSGVSEEQYRLNYANKEVSIACSHSLGIPASGDTAYHTYYARVSGCMLVSMNFCSIQGVLYKRFMQDPNDVNQWIRATVSIDSTQWVDSMGDINSYIKWGLIKYLRRNEASDKVGIKLFNLWHGISGLGGIEIAYKNESGQWIVIVTMGAVTNFESWRLSNGAYYFGGNPYTENYDFDGIGSVLTSNATILLPGTNSSFQVSEFRIKYLKRV